MSRIENSTIPLPAGVNPTALTLEERILEFLAKIKALFGYNPELDQCRKQVKDECFRRFSQVEKEVIENLPIFSPNSKIKVFDEKVIGIVKSGLDKDLKPQDLLKFCEDYKASYSDFKEVLGRDRALELFKLKDLDSQTELLKFCQETKMTYYDLKEILGRDRALELSNELVQSGHFVPEGGDKKLASIESLARQIAYINPKLMVEHKPAEEGVPEVEGKIISKYVDDQVVQYELKKKFTESGINAYYFEPKDKNEAEHDILIFRGTNDRESLKRDLHPTFRVIGKRDFDRNASKLIKMVGNSGRPLQVMGHSLGGCDTQRFVAKSMTAAGSRSKIKGYVFSSPKLDRETILKANNTAHKMIKMTYVHDKSDFVTWAGDQYLPSEKSKIKEIDIKSRHPKRIHGEAGFYKR